MVLSHEQDAPLIVITGITGQQGGSVFKAIEKSKLPYRVSGITRDTSKPASKALAAKDVDMIQCTLSKGHEKEIVKAFDSANYVFALTDYWSHLDMDREIEEGKLMVDCAKKAGVQTFIYSALPSYANAKGSKYDKVLHFEGKAKVNDYAKETLEHYIAVEPAMYDQNFAGGMAPRKQEDGSWGFFCSQGFSDATLSLIDINEDYGKFVVAAIEGKKAHGAEIFALSHTIKGKDAIAGISKASGTEIKIIEVPEETYQQALTGQMGELVATDFTQMLGAHYNLGYYPNVAESDLKKHLDLVPDLTSFDQYVQKEDWSKVIK